MFGVANEGSSLAAMMHIAFTFGEHVDSPVSICTVYVWVGIPLIKVSVQLQDYTYQMT